MKNLQKMTKGQLKTFAAKQGVELDMNDTKKVMIANFNKASKPAKPKKTVIKGAPVKYKEAPQEPKKGFWQTLKEYWRL